MREIFSDRARNPAAARRRSSAGTGHCAICRPKRKLSDQNNPRIIWNIRLAAHFEDFDSTLRDVINAYTAESGGFRALVQYLAISNDCSSSEINTH